MPRFQLLLALLLLTGSSLGASAAAPAEAFTLPGTFGPTAEDRHAETFATGLRDAIASGDSRRVAPFFPGRGPAFGWLGARWQEMRQGTLNPVSWQVAFEPYYARPDQLGGALTLVAREASGRAVSGRFDVEAWKRGRAWVVGDALPTDRPDALVTRHDLRVDLRKPGELVGEDVLTIQPTGPDRRFFLRLAPGLRASGASGSGQPVPYRQVRDTVYLELPAAASAYDVTLAYAGPVEMLNGTLAAGAGWYPVALGQATGSVFRVMAMVPPGQAAVAAGEFVGVDRYEDGWLHHWTTPMAVGGTSLASGPFQRSEGLVDVWAVGEHAELARALVREGPALVAYYRLKYGDPGVRKLTLVETTGDVAPSGGGLVALPGGALAHLETLNAVLPAAVARAWTGRLTYAGTPGEQAFMRDALAAYMGILARVERGGLPAMRAALGEAQRRYDQLAGAPGDVALAAAVLGGDRETYLRLIEDKGALTCHALRRTTGPEAFDRALRELFARPPGSPVDVAAFRRAFEQASGRSFSAFFTQWLGRAGRPDVTLADVGVSALPGGRFEVSGALVQGPGAPFFLAVPLVITTGGVPRVYELELRAARTPFALVVPARPQAVLIDPLRDALVAAGPDVELTPPRRKGTPIAPRPASAGAP